MIDVLFDHERNDHRLLVTLTEQVSSVVKGFETTSGRRPLPGWTIQPSDHLIQKHGRVRQQSDVNHPEQPLGDGRVAKVGRPQLKRHETSADNLVLLSDPVKFSVRKRSSYQQELIDTINRLRSDQWSDKQIAEHFNQSGKLTPRGCRWFPQSVTSIRKKAKQPI